MLSGNNLSPKTNSNRSTKPETTHVNPRGVTAKTRMVHCGKKYGMLPVPYWVKEDKCNLSKLKRQAIKITNFERKLLRTQLLTMLVKI